MKSRLVLLAVALAGALLCSACIVRSVHPWLKSDSLVFEEDLLGGWVGTADDEEAAMTFVRGQGTDYIVQYSTKDARGVFAGKLGKFGSDYYLDFRPLEGAPGVDGMLLFPTHSVARLEIGAGKLVVYPLNYEAVKVAASADQLRDVKYAWDEDKELVFISTSEELQRFLLSLGRDSKLFAEPIRLSRRK